jgi:hypothetical protein
MTRAGSEWPLVLHLATRLSILTKAPHHQNKPSENKGPPLSLCTFFLFCFVLFWIGFLRFWILFNFNGFSNFLNGGTAGALGRWDGRTVRSNGQCGPRATCYVLRATGDGRWAFELHLVLCPPGGRTKNRTRAEDKRCRFWRRGQTNGFLARDVRPSCAFWVHKFVRNLFAPYCIGPADSGHSGLGGPEPALAQGGRENNYVYILLLWTTVWLNRRLGW